MNSLPKFVGMGIALAVIVGATLPFHRMPGWTAYVIATVLVTVAGLMFRPSLAKPVLHRLTPNPDLADTTAPQPGTRRWARYLYHNGVISIEELAAYYERTQPDPGDLPSNHSESDQSAVAEPSPSSDTPSQEELWLKRTMGKL